MDATETFIPPVAVEDLWYGAQDTEGRNIDWSRGYGEDWTYHESLDAECDGKGRMECPDCEGTSYVVNAEGDHDDCTRCEGDGEVPCDFEGVVVVSGGGCWTCPKCDADHDTDYAEGPMYNEYYPLPSHGSFSSEDAAKLDGLAVVLINFHGGYRDEDYDGGERPDWALALSGCGMDMRWDIAEAYMRLGFMPPLFTCRLPRFAGTHYDDPRKVWVIEGCKRSAQAIIDSGQEMITYLDGLKGRES